MRNHLHAAFVVLCMPILFGCAHEKGMRDHERFQSRKMTIDGDIVLEFRGEVKDGAKGVPVPYAEILFVDTGLDKDSGVRQWTTRVGSADSKGRIDQRFIYGWYFESSPDELGVEWPACVLGSGDSTYFLNSMDAALDMVRAKATFTVELCKEGYLPVRLDIAVGNCAREGDAYIVDLGVVLMARQSTDSP